MHITQMALYLVYTKQQTNLLKGYIMKATDLNEVIKNAREAALTEVVDSLKAQQCNMFATFDSVEDIMSQFNVKGQDAAILMMAVNTVLSNIAHQLEAKISNS